VWFYAHLRWPPIAKRCILDIKQRHKDSPECKQFVLLTGSKGDVAVENMCYVQYCNVCASLYMYFVICLAVRTRADRASKFRGMISQLNLVIKSGYGFTTAREMKYSLLDNTAVTNQLTTQWPDVANAVFRIVQNYDEWSYFRKFFGGRSPSHPPLIRPWFVLPLIGLCCRFWCCCDQMMQQHAFWRSGTPTSFSYESLCVFILLLQRELYAEPRRNKRASYAHSSL